MIDRELLEAFLVEARDLTQQASTALLALERGQDRSAVDAAFRAFHTLKGVLKSAKGDFVALLQAPDNHTYVVHPGDKVLDGTVKAITQDAVVFSQDVNDPLSLVKQREVRKTIRPEAR